MSALRTAAIVRHHSGKTELRFTDTATGRWCCSTDNPTKPVLCRDCREKFEALRADLNPGAPAPPSLEAALRAANAPPADDVVAKRIKSFFLAGVQ